jgi:2-isopropylmalate synthase
MTPAPDRLFLYDTTLRDGAQTQGVQFTTADKSRIALVLDALGLDGIEGGWPGANPTDNDFFAAAPRTRATLTAFGMTRRSGRSADNDDVLAAVLNAGTLRRLPGRKVPPLPRRDRARHPAGREPGEHPRLLRPSRAKGRESLFDAEHFFDGFAPTPPTPSPASTPPCPRAPAGSSCATPTAARCRARSARPSRRSSPGGIPGDSLGIHAHDDTGNAVANSLAAVEAGARQIQGTSTAWGSVAATPTSSP